ncbi:MAG: hypothetical protein DI598_04750 [Pseudopedobacter saltans]|uniref:Uncharacterized protein n=1 Tax=Pseudopedobacter saltans TaxID=151895 RepID=A0A2W5HAQ1_9SPHI|nr:MAG: hypothetical protein DI598_04750 [Pseudopedobacter saltans]
MKKIFHSLAIIAISFASYKKAEAQVSVQINVGGIFSAAISSAPVMAAPIVANTNDYYYYDDINCYYDVANGQYIYPDNGVWYYSSAVPMLFENYNFRNARHIAMDRRAFMGRGINPIAFNRQPMMGNGRMNNMPMGNNRMNQDRFAQQNMARQPQMQERRMEQFGSSQPMMNNRGSNNPMQNRQMQQQQRSVTMNNNGREVRDSRRRGF